MTRKQVEKELSARGWVKVYQRGGHIQYEHPTKPKKVTVPCHAGDIPVGTLRSIFKQADLD